METKVATIDHETVSFTDIGSGTTPILMLHGGGPGSSGTSNFGPCVPYFSSSTRVILPDQPGFAGSSLPQFKGSYLDMSAGIMIRLLDHLNIGKVSVIGNSLGGGVGLTMARDFPDRIDRLILMNPAGASVPLFTTETAEIGMIRDYYGGEGPSLQRIETFAREMVFDPAAATQEIITQRYENSLLPGAREGASAALRTFDPRLENVESANAAHPPLWTGLQNINHRALLIWGREDRAASLDRAWFILARMQNVELHVLPNCGHWVQLEQPDAFSAISQAFLSNDTAPNRSHRSTH